MANEDLANLIGFIQDEADRKSAISLLEKYEPLRAGYLRQQDYDRNMDGWKAKVKEADDKINIWQDWYNRNNPIFETTVQENERLKTENTDLQGKIKTATEHATPPTNGNGSGQPIDQVQLSNLVEERLKGRGYVSQAEVTKIAQEEAQKLANTAQDRFFKETLPASIEFQSTILDLQFQHRDEFGKPLDRGAFAKFMKENQMTDPVKAYEQFVSETRTAKHIKTEVDKQVKDELSKHNVPGTMAQPSPQELGPMQLKIGKKDLPEIVYDESIRPGDNRLAREAAAELRAEGKF